MLGWLRWAAARASVLKRSIASGVAISPARTIFSDHQAVGLDLPGLVNNSHAASAQHLEDLVVWHAGRLRERAAVQRGVGVQMGQRRLVRHRGWGLPGIPTTDDRLQPVQQWVRGQLAQPLIAHGAGCDVPFDGIPLGAAHLPATEAAQLFRAGMGLGRGFGHHSTSRPGGIARRPQVTPLTASRNSAFLPPAQRNHELCRRRERTVA